MFQLPVYEVFQLSLSCTFLTVLSFWQSFRGYEVESHCRSNLCSPWTGDSVSSARPLACVCPLWRNVHSAPPSLLWLVVFCVVREHIFWRQVLYHMNLVGFFFLIQSIIFLICIVFNSFIFNTYIVAFINLRFCCFLSQGIPCLHFLFFFFFWLCDMPYRILVPQPGIEPRPLAVTAQSPTHWTTREFPVPPEFCPSSCCRDDDRHLSLLITVYYKIIQI